MKTFTLRTSLAVAAMTLSAGATVAPATVAEDSAAAAPKWEPRRTYRKLKRYTRHRVPRVPQRGELREALCLTPRALRDLRAAKAHGFEHTGAVAS